MSSVSRRGVPRAGQRDLDYEHDGAGILRRERKGGRRIAAVRHAGGQLVHGQGASVRARGGRGCENARLLLSSPLGRPAAWRTPPARSATAWNTSTWSRDAWKLSRPARSPTPRRTAGISWTACHRSGCSESTRRHSGILSGLLNSTIMRGRDPVFFSPGVRSLAELAWCASERQWPPGCEATCWRWRNGPGTWSAPSPGEWRREPELGGEALALVVTAEQAPNPRSHVTLDSRRDRFGVPLAHLHWELTPLDLRNTRGTQDALDARLRGLGIGTSRQSGARKARSRISTAAAAASGRPG